jgi:hypothetical protein
MSVVAEFPAPLSISDILNSETAARTARRDDPVGLLVTSVLRAAAPDAVFDHLVRPMLTGFPHVTRRRKVTMLATAFGADRKLMKRYLRAHGLCGPRD